MDNFYLLFFAALIVSCNSNNNSSDAIQSDLDESLQLENITEQVPAISGFAGEILDKQWILAAVRDSTGERFPVFQESDFQFTISEIQAQVFDQVLDSDVPVMLSLVDNLLLMTTGDNLELEFGQQSGTASEGEEITTYFNRFLLESSWNIDSYQDSTGEVTQIPREAEWQLNFNKLEDRDMPVMNLMIGPCFVAYKEYYTHDVDIRTQGELQSPDGSCDAIAQIVLPDLERSLLDTFSNSISFFAIVQESSFMTLQTNSGSSLSLSLSLSSFESLSLLKHDERWR